MRKILKVIVYKNYIHVMYLFIYNILIYYLSKVIIYGNTFFLNKFKYCKIKQYVIH